MDVLIVHFVAKKPIKASRITLDFVQEDDIEFVGHSQIHNRSPL